MPDTKVMRARMNNPVMILPDAMQALHSLKAATTKGVPSKTLGLVELRAGQISKLDLDRSTGQFAISDLRCKNCPISKFGSGSL
jgi:hypothetical protein